MSGAVIRVAPANPHTVSGTPGDYLATWTSWRVGSVARHDAPGAGRRPPATGRRRAAQPELRLGAPSGRRTV